MKNNIDKFNYYFNSSAPHHITSNNRKISALIEIGSKAKVQVPSGKDSVVNGKNPTSLHM